MKRTLVVKKLLVGELTAGLRSWLAGQTAFAERAHMAVKLSAR